MTNDHTRVVESRAHFLERVVTLMHFDPEYAAWVLGGGYASMPPDILQMLQAHDLRAFTCDALRPARLVLSLVEEFPLSAQLIGKSNAMAFCQSIHFHQAIGLHTSLAHAFAAYARRMEMDRDRQAGIGVGVIHIEAAVARARRRQTLAVAADIVEDGTVEFYASTREGMAADHIAAFATGRLASLDVPQPTTSDRTGIVVTIVDGHARLREIGVAIARIISAGENTTEAADLVHAAIDEGCEPTEARTLIHELADEGLIRLS